MQHARHQEHSNNYQQQHNLYDDEQYHPVNDDDAHMQQERDGAPFDYRPERARSQNDVQQYYNDEARSSDASLLAQDYHTYSQNERYPPAQLQRTNSNSSESEYYSYASDASLPHYPSIPDEDNGGHSLQRNPSEKLYTPLQQQQHYVSAQDVRTPYQPHHRDSSASAGSMAAVGGSGGSGHRGGRTGHASDSSLSSEIDANPLLRQDLHKNGKPKRPLNSFMIFSRFRRPNLQREKPTMKVAELARELAGEWKNLPPEEKRRFQEDAKVVKQNFHKMHPDYVYSRRPNGAKNRKAKRSTTPSSAGSSGGSGGRRRSTSRLSSDAGVGGGGSAGSGSISAFSPGGYSSSASSSAGSLFFPPMPLPLSHPASRDRSTASSPGLPPGTAASGSTAFGAAVAAADQGLLSPSPASAMDLSATNMFASMDLDHFLPPNAPPPTPLAPRYSRHSSTSSTLPQPVFGDPVLLEYPREGDARNASSSSSGSSYGSETKLSISSNSFMRSVDSALLDHQIPQSRARASTPPPHMYNNAIHNEAHAQQATPAAPAHYTQYPMNSWTTPSISQGRSAHTSSAPSSMMHHASPPPQAPEQSQLGSPRSPLNRSHTIASTKRKPPVAGISRMMRNRNGSQGSLSSDDSGTNSFYASHTTSRRATTDSREDPYLLPAPSQQIQQQYYQRPGTPAMTNQGGGGGGGAAVTPSKGSLPSLSNLGLDGSARIRTERGQAPPIATPPAFYNTHPAYNPKSRGSLGLTQGFDSGVARDSAIDYSSSPSSYESFAWQPFDPAYQPQRHPQLSASMPSLHQHAVSNSPLPALQPIQPKSSYQQDRFKLPPLNIPQPPKSTTADKCGACFGRTTTYRRI